MLSLKRLNREKNMKKLTIYFFNFYSQETVKKITVV